MVSENFIIQVIYRDFGLDLFIIIFVLGGVLGAPIFSLKGNQGQAWKPAGVRYIGSAGTVQVSFILSVRNL